MNTKLKVIFLIVGIIFIGAFSSFAQNKIRPTGKLQNDLHETMKDKYLPNAFNNKKTSPPYKFTNKKLLPEHKSIKTGHVRTSNSIIETTQVNVDASGQNIIGDAANEPSIAVNPLDSTKIVIGWRQFDNIASDFRQAGWGFTTDAGQSWTFPGDIEQGLFRSDPALRN